MPLRTLSSRELKVYLSLLNVIDMYRQLGVSLQEINAIAMQVVTIAGQTASALYNRPLYDSGFTGADWVRELINGHPDCIHCALGVHKHVFHPLVSCLGDMGYQASQKVTLEEQLAIFLYMFVTGLSIPHIFLENAVSFHLPPFYTKYINLPQADDLDLHHAAPHNTTEQAFDILKHHFVILSSAPHYDLDTQGQIPAALAAVQNFIYDHDPGELGTDAMMQSEDSSQAGGSECET